MTWKLMLCMRRFHDEVRDDEVGDEEYINQTLNEMDQVQIQKTRHLQMIKNLKIQNIDQLQKRQI